MATSGTFVPGSVSADLVQVIAQLLTTGTAALAQLDLNSLEQLQDRALELQMWAGEGQFAPIGGGAAVAQLASHRRIFSGLLQSTGEQLTLLQRIGNDQRISSWDR